MPRVSLASVGLALTGRTAAVNFTSVSTSPSQVNPAECQRPPHAAMSTPEMAAAFDDAGVSVDLEGSGILAVEVSTILG